MWGRRRAIWVGKLERKWECLGWGRREDGLIELGREGRGTVTKRGEIKWVWGEELPANKEEQEGIQSCRREVSNKIEI